MPQLAPKPPPASQIVTAGPPATGTFFSLPSAKKPIHWLSGEKNGLSALVVPGTGTDANRLQPPEQELGGAATLDDVGHEAAIR